MILKLREEEDILDGATEIFLDHVESAFQFRTQGFLVILWNGLPHQVQIPPPQFVGPLKKKLLFIVLLGRFSGNGDGPFLMFDEA